MDTEKQIVSEVLRHYFAETHRVLTDMMAALNNRIIQSEDGLRDYELALQRDAHALIRGELLAGVGGLELLDTIDE